VKSGRLLSALVVLALLALAGSAAARLQTHRVRVVSGKGFSLSAWDKRDAGKSVCFKLVSGKQSRTRCETAAQRKAPARFASFKNSRHHTLLGGVAQNDVTEVVAFFTDGKTLTMKTRAGTRYKGRLRGKVRFWAGRYSGTAALKSVQTMGGSGSPTPLPPPPPNPCGCHGQPFSRIVCPLTPCPE
jgi:hypothetical protein